MNASRHPHTSVTVPSSDCAPLFPPATRFVRLRGDYGTHEFVMFRGGRLPEVFVAYETWGELSSNKDNVVLILTGLSASAHASSSPADPTKGWWEHIIGPGKALDTDRFYVVCMNSLGSCFGSTSPGSINPDIKRPYGLEFPELTVEDIAKAAHHALHDMGIGHLRAIVGPSMGGMSALAYVLQYPDEVDAMVLISSACRALPFTIAVRSLQREIIRCDPMWKSGSYRFDEQPGQGMLLARKLGLMSYRAAEEWHQRFNRARVPAADTTQRKNIFDIEFEVENYLDYNARKFVRGFDANSYLYLSRAMDIFDVADHGGSVNAGLAKVHTRQNLVIGVETDILFPVMQQHQLADGLRQTGHEVEYVVSDAIHGHDSFLIDDGKFAPVLGRFFDRIE